MSDNVKAGSLQPAGPQLLPAATQAAASPAFTNDVYVGEDCISGACALCNPEHPGHADAKAEIDRWFGIAQ